MREFIVTLRQAIRFCFTFLCCCAFPLVASVDGIEIVVDYTYDTQGFFDEPIRRTAIEAVANRYSQVITSELLAVEPVLDLGQPTTWRIGFDHPGIGGIYQLSTAPSRSEDPIFSSSSDEADEYGFAGLAENEWILFAGARSLANAGLGGTATGRNFTNVFDAVEGPMHRGVIDNTPSNSINDLPAWGGAITFDINSNWHFDLTEVVGNGEIDFYSIAMHEVGHALGLSNSWNQWERNVSGSEYRGEHAVAAYNKDNDTTLDFLATESSNNLHWSDGNYQSYIFPLGSPNRVGTVGDGLQDLLLEPIANFSSTTRRFELTNVDAAALVDVGWSILADAGDPLDLDGNGELNGNDIDLACAAGSSLEPYFAELDTLAADFDLDGTVGFSDFLVLSANFGKSAAHSGGDVTCDGQVGFDDFLLLSGSFGSSTGLIQSIPEPNSLGLAFCSTWLLLAMRRLRDDDPATCS